MSPYLLKNPAIGMNASASVPVAARLADIANIPVDVIRDVH
jgi:hypothetical protein